MADLGRVAVCAILVCSVLGVLGEKWRFVLKRLYECEPQGDDAPDLLIAWRGVKVTFLQHGDVFKLEGVVNIARDTNITSTQTELYKDGVVPVKFLSWRNRNPCKTIADGNGFMAPLFGEDALPRTCHLSQGVYPVRMVFDITGEMPGSSFRLAYAFVVRFFEGETPSFCARGHGIFKKNVF